MPNYYIPNLIVQNGKYSFTASLGKDPITGKRIQARRGGFKTKKECWEAYMELINEHEKKQEQSSTNDSSITFKEFVDEWFIPYYMGEVSEQTFATRKSIIDNHFQAFHHKALSNITKADIEQWRIKLVAKRIQQGKTRHNHVRTAQQILSMIFDRAILLDFCTANPSRELGSRSKDDTEIQFWTIEEFEKVCTTFCPSDYYQHFGFTTLNLLMMTGLRIGEATALTWEDLDFEKGVITINKSLIYKNAHDFSFTKPKTKSSVRKVAIDQETLQLLKDWKERQQNQANSPYVLSYNGIPTNKITVRHIIRRHAKLAGVKEITVHGLRHSHASMLINIGENPLILKERLGHKDIQTTLGTYSHMYPNRDFDLVSRLNGIIKKSFSKSDQTSYQGNQYLKMNEIVHENSDGDTSVTVV